MKFGRNISVTAALFVCALVAFSHQASAELVVDVTKPNVTPLPIAVTSVTGADAKSNQTAVNIANTVSADLARSGLFAPIDKQAFIEKISDMGLRPRFGDWRIINA